MTSNFAFVRETYPQIYEDCARAESYLTTDPRSACVYARRASELLVHHLYRLWNLPEPYRDDLAARTNEAAFKAKVGNAVGQKLNLIRRLGNSAAHATTPTPKTAAADALRELHHVFIWAAFHHSTRPDAVPTQSQFDPALAAQAAPLGRAEVIKLAKKFRAQDEEHAKQLAERDDLLAARDAEIERLRAEIATAQATKTAPDDHDYSEAETRDSFIDTLLREAGWDLDAPRVREYKVSGMPNESGIGYVDYVLWGADGLPLAVVEAKRTKDSPQVGQEQAARYAACLEADTGRRPVIFYTNGYEHWLWDDAGGYPPRQVQGFYTADELELLIRRRTTREPLNGAPIDSDIVERHYQHHAIASVGAAFDAKQRDALLVMATGAGKTRTVIALIDQLMKQGWVKRVLFLADRTALVKQATRAFAAHLPGTTPVNLLSEKHTDGRVYVSTYPTMLNLINEVEDDQRTFGPGYFDLVVIDEAHRSVYAKYGAIFDYFDSLLVGLTATPKDEVDHNTYRLFQLEDGVPTDSYGLEDAVADGYLVPPKGVAVGTKFLRSGIKYQDLTEEEKDQWDTLEWGDESPPDEVGAEELNRFLFNEDTVDKVLATLMGQGYTVAGGDRIGKTIIFAKNQAHAEFIQRRFDHGWPEHAGRLARVITHSAPYAGDLIDDFGIADRAPHIAISVDMLDTGIDVPEVVNLVFFKLVRSKSKFWQMIGRGTRLCPDLFGPGADKSDFLVFDFCGNLEYFNQDLPSTEGAIQKSLTQRIAEARIDLVVSVGSTAGTDDGAARDVRASAADALHQYVSGMNLDNVLVRPHRRAVERFADRSAWEQLKPSDAEDAVSIAGLPSSVQDGDEAAKRFDLLILSRQLADLHGDAVAAERVRQKVQAIAEALLTVTTIPSVAAHSELIEAVSSDQWWQDVTLQMLELARLRLRGLAQFARSASRNPVYTDFEDTLSPGEQVSITGTTPGTDPERFLAKATAYLRRHENHVALQRLRRNRPLTGADLEALQEMLIAAGGGQDDLARAQEHPGGLGLFIRSLVGLDRQAALEAFADYLDSERFTAEQIHFVNLIVDELTRNGHMAPGRLFESPYTDTAPTGPIDLFPAPDVEVLTDILDRVRANASPA